MQEQIYSTTIQTLIETAIENHQNGKLSQAEFLYKQVLLIFPACETEEKKEFLRQRDNLAIIKMNLATVLRQQGLLEEAVQYYREALSLDPNFAEAYNNLANTLHQQGKLEEAAQYYRQALTLRPDFAEACNNLGNILQGQHKLEEATQYYHQALSLNPNFAEAHYNLGNIYEQEGKLEEAIESYQQSLSSNPDFVKAKFGLCMSQLPVIYSSFEEIELRRNNYQTHLQQLAQDCQSANQQERAKLAEAVGSIQPFLLAYQGLNDRYLQKIYGETICQLMASRYPQWSEPIAIPPLKTREKIRVGFVSGYFHNHSVWKIPLKGWVQNLDRSKFELFGYYTDSKKDLETAIAGRAFDKFVQGSLPIEKWGETISDDKLHILIFPEFGMDPVTVQLGCLRLAPIQITSWGHPDTSGMPTIDYYLSSDLMEPDNAQNHYTEKLVRLPNLSIYYTPLLLENQKINRQDIGVEDDDIMFWCCQSLYKYLPQDDDIYPKIAKELGNCKFVFIEYLWGNYVTDLFRQRLSRAFEIFGLNYQDYCRFLPRMNPTTFAATAALADVTLDSIGWSGCNSTLESIARDIPVVTLPGDLMRGRHTLAVLKMIGVEQTIAISKDDYVEIAVRLGREPEYRQEIARQIAENKHKLYGDLKLIIALENFLLNAVHNKALQLAIHYHRGNQLTQAEQIYQKILESQPDHSETLYSFGVLSNQIGERERAEQLFKHYLKINPKSAKAWVSLGNLYQTGGQLTKAVEAYKRALVLQPNSVSVYNNLGYALQQQEKWQEAIPCYQKALLFDPKCIEAEVNLANSLHAQGQLPPKKRIYYADVNLNLGKTQQKQGNLSGATVCYQQAIALHADLVEAHYHLGTAFGQQGQSQEAIACYEKVLELNPSDEQAYNQLGKIYQTDNCLQEAAFAYQQKLKLLNPLYAQRIAMGQSTEIEQAPIQLSKGGIFIGGQIFPVIPPVMDSQRKRPFWSVVIPVYNRTQYILQCLTSVLAQWTGEQEMEILVIDDASTFPIDELVNSIGKGIVRYYRNPYNLGQQENWNRGVALSRGEWIHLLHDDDYVLPGFYEQLRQSLENCPQSVRAAFTGYENINEKEEIIFSQQVYENQKGIVKDFLQRIGVSNVLNPPAVVIRRSAYERLGGYHRELTATADWEFYKRMSVFYEWWYEPEILARYRQHSNSMTTQLSLAGTREKDIRRAIEISESYLPVKERLAITTKSRQHYFHECLANSAFALKTGNPAAAFCLLQEAFKINNSREAGEQLFAVLNQEEAASLREQFISQLLVT